MITATCPECDHVQERPTDKTAELRCMVCGIVFALPILSPVKLKKAPPTNDELPTKKDAKPEKAATKLAVVVDESEDDTPPKTPKKAKSFDEDQSEPRSKKKAAAKSSGSRKRRDTSDDDDAVRRGSRGLHASGMRLMIGLIVAGALLLGTVGVGWYLYSNSKIPTVAVPPKVVAPIVVAPVKIEPPVKPERVLITPFIVPPEKVMAITPTLAVDGAEVKLPGKADRVCYGGGGRFVLLRIPSVKQIAVLDLSLGKVAKYIPLAEDGALFAAGMNKLYIYCPNAAVFQRWDLSTFEKEATVPNTQVGVVDSLLIGHATDGPLYIGESVPDCFIDGQTFKAIETKLKGDATPGKYHTYKPSARISADGRVIGWWQHGSSPSGFNSFVIDFDEAKLFYQNKNYGPVLSGPDGTLFTGGGIYTPEQKQHGNSNRQYDFWHYTPIPPVHGRVYVDIVNVEDDMQKRSGRATLKIVGDDRPFALLDKMKGLENIHELERQQGIDLPLYDRVYLAPNAKVLAVLAPTSDKVYLNAFDLNAILGKSDADYLGVMNLPPNAVRGMAYRYELEVFSKHGMVTLKLESGPLGMKIDGNAIVWDVPKSTEKPVDVILTVSDKSGQETLHKFSITVNVK